MNDSEFEIIIYVTDPYVSKAQAEFTSWASKADIECHFCEIGEYYRVDNELVCDSCLCVPHSEERDDLGPWESFWEEREQYMDEPDERPYCVGSFKAPYIYDD